LKPSETFCSAAEICEASLRVAASCELFQPSIAPPEGLLSLVRPQPPLFPDVRKQLAFCDHTLYPQKGDENIFERLGRGDQKVKREKKDELHLSESFCVSVSLLGHIWVCTSDC